MLISFVGILNQFYSLDNFYLVNQPITGGSYNEGIVGEVKIMNPIFIDSAASTTVNKLVYSSLVQFDGKGNLIGDLAKSWEVSRDARTYTFHLVDNARWHDDHPLTSEDVAFTIGLIQNPDTRSVLLDNWKGVKVETINPSTIRMVLPSAYPNFLSTTTVGILPKHLLSDVAPAQLRLSEFNTRPIGSGAFVYDKKLSKPNHIVLNSNPSYYHATPKLSTFGIVTFANTQKLIEAYSKQQIQGFYAVAANELSTAQKLPNIISHTAVQPSYIALFFNTKQAKLNDPALRRGLSAILDRSKIIEKVYQPETAKTQNVPLFNDQLGLKYISTNTMSSQEAKSYLKQKFAGSKLQLNLVTRDTPELMTVAKEAQAQFAEADVDLQIHSYDLATLQQGYIRSRKYDILLYGQNVGANGDVYNFWHSSQSIDPGLNVSAYSNPVADRYLESARLAQEIANKRAKQQLFLQTWEQDMPAAILYSPHFVYFQQNNVTGFSASRLIEPESRFYNVSDWAVRYNRIGKATTIK